MSLSPTELEVMKHAFTAIPEQMGAALQRSAYSPNIKERKDESCAIFTADQKMLAQAEHIPVHLGAMPSSLDAAVDECEMAPGDQIILNDPYAGGTHLPDITLIKPVFDDGHLLGYVVNRAHHADVGGDVPGSMPGDSKTLDEEGIVLSPMHLVKEGEICSDVLDKLREARSPEERVGDIRAQMGANQRGAEELVKTVRRFGKEKYEQFTREIMEYSETRTRKVLEELPDGEYEAQDLMEWEPDVELNVSITVDGDSISFDFTGTSAQVEGNINAPEPVSLSAVYYLLRCILPGDVPINEGCYRPVDVFIPLGTVLNPEPPAAVSAGNVETSQRVVELLLRAMQPALPGKICAESQGTMNNLIIGNDRFTYYETIGGGAGACPQGDGESGVHVHMTNTKNTPVEALENDYPLLVHAYRLRDDSGGIGLHKGGDGIIRDIEVLEDAYLSIQSERRKYGPKGLAGGGDGRCGRNVVVRDGLEETLKGKASMPLDKGDRVRVETPGGGGWGEED